jgi:aspartyl-tRNA synthetase
MSWRDLLCGDVRSEHVGRRIALAGWAARRRDHGGLVFIDLRDHTGLCQLVINPERAREAAEVAHDVRNEFVLRAEGEVVPRAPDAVNPNLATGAVELQVDALEIVSRSEPLPFQLDEEGVDEQTRLRYRYLDLRRDKMQHNLRLSATVVSAIRRHMEARGFVDVWTPNLTKATPEGARDFIVPVRLQPGRFFALPQSPQLFKQILMVAGLDRYYQIATCFRDEDLRADRQFEFRQLDVELAFPTREEVLDVLEGAVVASFEALGRAPPPRPFPQLVWDEAMARYGTDKPDLRFGLEIEDVTEATRGSGFGVFASAPVVRRLTVPREYSRAELARLEAQARELGAKGLAYLVVGGDGEVRSPIAKFLSEGELASHRGEPGTTVLFAADEPAVAAKVLGALRTQLGADLGLTEGTGDAFAWIVDFPLFEWKEDEERWTFSHHPFTGVAAGQEELIESSPESVLSQAYDLVWNGWELGSGSIRIHEPEIQERVFRVLGLTPDEIQERFGFLLEVMRMGPPPHGGFALGLDRFLALLAGAANIREVIAFPKTASGSEPMTGAPSAVSSEQLRELGIPLATGAAAPQPPPPPAEAPHVRVVPAEPDPAAQPVLERATASPEPDATPPAAPAELPEPLPPPAETEGGPASRHPADS